MIGLSEVLLAGLVPLLVAALARRLGAPTPLAMAIALVAAMVALGARPGLSDAAGPIAGWSSALPRSAAKLLSPAVAKDWLAIGALLAAGVALAIDKWPRVATAVGVALGVGVPVRLLWGSVYFRAEWSRVESIAVVAGVGAALVAIVALWRRGIGPASESPRFAGVRPLATVGVALAAGLTLMLSGSQGYGELGAAMGASILGAWLARPSDTRGVGVAGPVVATVLGGLLLLGVCYAELRPLNAAILGAALALTGARGPTDSTWRGVATRAAIVGALAIAAVGIAGADFAATLREQQANPYSNVK
jgi:hypothetical protein